MDDTLICEYGTGENCATDDYNGNTSTKVDSTGTTQYFWDFENRLTSVTLPASGGNVTFVYDPFGRRIKKVTSSTTSIFAYDGDNLIEETSSSGAAVARYSHGLTVDEPLAMLRSSTTSFYQADGLGSVTSLSNTAGSLAQTYGYNSFGKQTSSSGSLINPFQYTARDFDPETNLQLSRARYYDANTGRFLSEDPIRFNGGNDFYEYVDNNVIGSRDPFGLAPQDAFWPIAIDLGLYYACANRIKHEFNHFSREGHPRYAHCMASCNLVKQCGSKAAAFLTGYGKEFLDVLDCVRTSAAVSCNTAMQPSDLEDNKKGRSCPKDKPCADQCNDLADKPDGDPSPLYYWWPVIRGVFGGVFGGNPRPGPGYPGSKI